MPFFSLFSLPLVLLILSTQLYASTVPCDSSVNLTNLTNCNDTQPQGFKPDSINDMRMQRKRQPYFQIFHRQKKISTMLKAIPMITLHQHQYRPIRVIMMLTMQMKKLMIEKKMMEMNHKSI